MDGWPEMDGPIESEIPNTTPNTTRYKTNLGMLLCAIKISDLKPTTQYTSAE